MITLLRALAFAPRSCHPVRRAWRVLTAVLVGLALAGGTLGSARPRAAAQNGAAATLPSDGFFMAVTSDGVRQVWRLPFDGTAAYPVTAATGDVSAFAVAAPPDALAYAADGQVWVQPVPPLGTSPAPQPVVALSGSAPPTLTFSADGSSILYTDGGLWQASVDGDTLQQVLADADLPPADGQPRTLRQPRVIPGAPDLVLVDLVGAERTSVAVLNLTTGVLAVPPGALGLSNRAVPLPEGRLAVFNNDLRQGAPLGLTVLDARALNDAPLATFAPQPGVLELVLLDVTPAADGTLIALSQTFAPQPDGTLALAQSLAALDPASGNVAPLAPLSVALAEPLLGPGGAFVAGFLDGTLTRDGEAPAGQLVLVNAATGALLALNQDLLVSRYAWPPVALDGAASGPVLTIIATPTVQAAATPAPTPSCVNAAEFVGDVTIPDGTQVQVGVPFTKTWRVRNTGTCTWGPSYTVPLVNGQSVVYNARFPSTLGVVAPGQTADVSVPLVLLGGRVVNGQTVTSTFQLRAADGTYFGPTLSARVVALVPCVYNAALVADLSTPNGTPLELGQTVTKTWRLLNTGNCAWGPNFAFVRLERGLLEILPGGGIIPLTEPGQTADISVTFRLPADASVITGQRLRVTFQLRTPNGTLFGARPIIEVAAVRPGDVLDENGNVVLPLDQCATPPLAPLQEGASGPTVGERAFSTVNGLPLYSGRSNTQIVVRVPRLTSFAVVDGPYCYLVPNTSPQQGFRRWQVQLDDGTLGWANEFFGTPSTGFTYQIERDQVITIPNPIVILAFTVSPNPAPAGSDLAVTWQVEGAASVRLVTPGATFEGLALNGTLSSSVASLSGGAPSFDVTLEGVNAANPALTVRQTITVSVLSAEAPTAPLPTEEASATAEATPTP